MSFPIYLRYFTRQSLIAICTLSKVITATRMDSRVRLVIKFCPRSCRGNGWLQSRLSFDSIETINEEEGALPDIHRSPLNYTNHLKQVYEHVIKICRQLAMITTIHWKEKESFCSILVYSLMDFYKRVWNCSIPPDLEFSFISFFFFIRTTAERSRKMRYYFLSSISNSRLTRGSDI